MGCDGGTIPKRHEQVKTKKIPEKNSKDVENAAKWNYCRLSQIILQSPIVADLLGYLYNKDMLIQFLLDRSKYEKGPEYIKSIKDVKELILTPNPGFRGEVTEVGGEFVDLNQSRWICPVSGVEMNGNYKFLYSTECGCAISEKAMKTMSASSMTCLKCDKPYTEKDLIVLNPNEEDLVLNSEKLKLKQESKKSKKSSKTASHSISERKEDKPKDTPTTSISDLVSSTLKSSNDLAVKDVKETPATNGSLKRPHSNVAVTTSKKVEVVKKDGKASDAKKAKGIQDDPNTSNVYKSLFTSSDRAKNQTKAHWVTFNPQYF